MEPGIVFSNGEDEMNQNDYQSRMQASIAYVRKKEMEKKGLGGHISGPSIVETRPVHEIINDRIGETLDPNLTELEFMMLCKDADMLKGIISKDLSRGNYDDVVSYSQRILTDCGLIEGSALYNPKVFSIDYHKDDARRLLKQAEILRDNPQHIAEMKLQLEDCVREERYEDAARIKADIESAERLMPL